MGLYAKDLNLYADDYMEFYIPKNYFINNKYAINLGESVETFGVIYSKTGKSDKYQLFTIPARIKLAVYNIREDNIQINGSNIPVYVLEYMKDSFVMKQSIIRGIAVASDFFGLLLDGKLPSSLSYDDILSIWWNNINIAGFTLNAPSKMMELILSEVYRDPNNKKRRFGQIYGKKEDVSPYSYASGNVKDTVLELSTYSAFAFEDMGKAISSGINNSIENTDESVSPLEKIIYY